MKLRSIVALLATVALTASCMGACSKNNSGAASRPEPDTFVEAGEVEPIPEVADGKAQLNAELEKIAETDVADFYWTEAEDGVEITQYLGNATEVRVPAKINGKAVVKIGTNAFRDNQTLTALILPDGVVSLGLSVLEGCTALETLRTPTLGENTAGKRYLGYLFGAESYEDNPLKVPATLKNLSLGSHDGVLTEFSLYDCNDLSVVVLEDSVHTLERFAFYNCASLEWINVDGLRLVGEGTFHSCSALISLHFGDYLTDLGFSALEGCISLRELTVPFVGGSQTENGYMAYVFGASAPDFSAGFYPRNLTRVVVSDSCTILANYAFFECATLAYVELPENVTSVGVRAFYGCTNLRKVEIPAAVTKIAENAFFGCSNLKEVTFGEGSVLSTLGINAFYGCRSLTEITLPRTLESLPASCFADCKKLSTVYLGGVSSVGKNAFRNCKSLTYVGVYKDVSFAEGNESASAVVRLLA